jgi:formate dehydrogenase subunit gamma
VREGVRGQVSIPDKNAAQLVQSDGEAWRNFRNGPLPRYGAWGLGGVIIVLAAFFLLRGRIAIEHGLAGRTLTRFDGLERFGHWLLAASFIILALTGLNILYGRYVLLPVIGKEAFAALSQGGKWLHNYVAFAFMIGLALTFIVWIRHNFPTLRDVVWLAKGGGMLVKGSHPPAWKFNAGQKILFWLVMLGGLSISLSGIALMFPFQTAMFAKTFALINVLGFSYPTDLTPLQEMQYASSWHAIVALVLVGLIIAHIYIGTLGMEGAFSAMGSGEVDENWAKEHHSLWAEEELKKENDAAGTGRMVAAE